MVLLKSDAKRLKKGDRAPDFYLKNIDGRYYGLNDFKGKILVIIFMCNHCPYVKAKMDEIASIQNDYEDEGVVVIGINSNDPSYSEEDSYENMQKIAKEKGYKYYLIDETQEVARAYGATCTPDPFVFDKDHRLVYHGRINDAMEPGDKITKNDLREILDKVIKREDVEGWFVPSVGCSIKWKE
jgi:peroxiredoxin